MLREKSNIELLRGKSNGYWFIRHSSANKSLDKEYTIDCTESTEENFNDSTSVYTPFCECKIERFFTLSSKKNGFVNRMLIVKSTGDKYAVANANWKGKILNLNITMVFPNLEQLIDTYGYKLNQQLEDVDVYNMF